MATRSVRRGERAGPALCPARAPCGSARVGQRGGAAGGSSWSSWAPPRERLTLLVCSPALRSSPPPPPLSLLASCLLHHSLSPPLLSCCSPPHPQSRLVQVLLLQCQSRSPCGEPVGLDGAEVKRRAPCRTRTDLDGWRRTCETKRERVKKNIQRGRKHEQLLQCQRKQSSRIKSR